MSHNAVMGMRTQRGLVAVTAVTALVAGNLGAAGSVNAQQAGEPQMGGRLVVAAEQDPTGGLNHWLVCCTLAWTEWLVDNLLPDAYALAPDHTYVPEVIEGEAIVTTDPFTVTYEIKDEAQWNDGVPVSAHDFAFTKRAYVNPHNFVASREGYELIRSANVIDDKTVSFEFRRPYPDYKDLFTDVFPKHILQGENLNHVWRRSIPISAGPFEFGEYERGSHLTLVRNDDYWGDHPAYLDEVEFRFILDVPDQIDALASGEVDVIYPSLHPRLAEVRSFPDVSVQSSPGTLWEHLDFQFQDDRLRKPYMRRAIAYAIDRQAIIDEVIRPIDPDVVVLDSLVYGINEPAYEPHFDRYRHDVAAARQILDDHGCEPNADGIYVCGRHLLRFEYTTTAPNPIRKRVAELIRSQLDAVGIEVEVRRRDPATVFGYRVLVAGNYDLFNYAWTLVGPTGDQEIWRCRGFQNFTNYCNTDIGALFKEAEFEIDPARRARLVNLADDVMASDIPSLPLYQRPTFLAYSTRVQGLLDNPTSEGFTWNIGDWWLDPTP